jgi:DNA invertase Pin-like site-specific DNA recombinase
LGGAPQNDKEDQMNTYGYARVSTRGQDLTIQKDMLSEAGCERVFAEKMSAAKSDNRQQLKWLIATLGPGEIVVVTRLDRIARSSRDLHNLIHEIAEAGAMFKSLAAPWCDTSTALSKLVLTILGGIGEFERSLILARTSLGPERAKARGIQFGRKSKLNARQKRMVVDRDATRETMSELAEFFDCSKTAIFRALNPE